MSIHTIGDSHSDGSWNGIVKPTKNLGSVTDKEINPSTEGADSNLHRCKHHIGPCLCYSFGKEKLDRCDIRNFNIKDGDTIIFCFGEIDCRCHIHKHITDTISYKNIIKSIVSNYFDAIILNMMTSDIRLKNVCVFNVVPPVQRANTLENPEYPYFGSDEERRKYVLYFNKKLKQRCIHHGFILFDVYDKYIDENGFLRKDLSDGNVHIKNGIFKDIFIAEHLLR